MKKALSGLAYQWFGSEMWFQFLSCLLVQVAHMAREKGQHKPQPLRSRTNDSTMVPPPIEAHHDIAFVNEAGATFCSDPPPERLPLTPTLPTSYSPLSP